jgi:flagellar protein FlbD
MILITRINGDEMYLNPDLIERMEATPDTVVSLVDGRKYVAVETPHELITRIVAFRASVLVAAETDYAALGPAGRPSTTDPRQSAYGAVTAPRPLRLLEDTPGE